METGLRRERCFIVAGHPASANAAAWLLDQLRAGVQRLPQERRLLHLSLGAIMHLKAASTHSHLGATSVTTLPEHSCTIYSIGHSDHQLGDFIAMLRHHHINTLVDVRSQPYSRWVPAYNREEFARALKTNGFTFIYMGDTLGGRPSDPSLYHSGQAEKSPDYERIAETPSFRAGIEKLLHLARNDTVALMCSEGDHRQCHRAKLITPSLLALDARVIHIQPDGRAVEARPEPKQLSLF